MMKKVLPLSFILISLLLVSCSKKETAKKTGSEKVVASAQPKTIGFSIDTLAIERWQRDLDVFVNRAKELGANVIVQNAGNDIEEQNRQLMYLMNRGVDVIVCLPKDDDGISESIQKIKSKNIPVISYDRLIRNADVDIYLSINSEKVGELMARQMSHISNATKWHLILGAQEDFNMTLIQQGINGIIRGSPIHIAHIFYTSGWNYDLAYQEMVNILARGTVPEAIICGNDAVADSVISALNLYYPEHHIPICGQDAEIAACQNIVEGKQDFTIYKPISALAEIAAEYAVKIAKGASIEELGSGLSTIDNGFGEIPVLWLEPQVVTKENIDSVIIDSGFHTYNEIYRNKQD